jgi:hypothetical protein
MAKKVKIPIIKVHIDRFLFLLISLILWFVLSPFLEGLLRLSTLFDLFVTFILLSGVFAVIQKKGVFIFGLIFAISTIILRWSIHFLNISSLEMVNHILGILFMGFIVGIILSYLFKEEEITRDVIMAAICVFFNRVAVGWCLCTVGGHRAQLIPNFTSSQRSGAEFYLL